MTNERFRWWIWGVGVACLWVGRAGAEPPPQPGNGRSAIELNDNGAWSWCSEERAIVDRGQLIVGSVRAVGTFGSHAQDPRWGNVEVSVLDIASGQVRRVVLHEHFEQDDHDSPAFLILPDHRYLAVYSKHSVERKLYVRTSEPGDPLTWGPATVVETPGADHAAFGGNNVTYANLFQMSGGRIINFFRGYRHDPNYMISDDSGRTWTYGGRLIKGRGGYSPYLKYAFDGQQTIHFITTEDHPRNFANSIYHGMLREGVIQLSDGTPRGELSKTIDANVKAWDLTRVFQGDPDNVAWVIDLELDRDHRPYLAFSIQKDGRGLRPKEGGMDHRFGYARWDGSSWHAHEIAY